ERYAPFNIWIYSLTVATSLALLLAAIVPRRHDSADRLLDFCTMGLSATVASPIAWEHHCGILLPIFRAACEHPAASPSADGIYRQLRAGQQFPACNPTSCGLSLERHAVLSIGRSARRPVASLSPACS